MIIVIPFLLMAVIIANQALSMYYYISSQMVGEQMNSAVAQWLEYISPLRDALLALGISEGEIIRQLRETVGQASNILYTNVMDVLRGFTNMIINFVLIIFVTFYLLMDGRRMGLRLLSLSPMPSSLNTSISLDILHSMRTTLKGTLLLAMLQGVAGGLGLWAASVPNAPFWGTVMIFTSVVPIVGIALVWIPAVLYLLFVTDSAAAILLGAWCLLVGLTCDNIIRPKLLGSGRNLHPLFTFFSVLGGLNLFGMVGLFMGPLILAILVSLLDVYERYFLSPPPAEPALPAQEPKVNSKPESEL
jgi:predicted PurR-regulated permease PerM